MNYTADTKLPLYDNNCDEKTKEMYTISSFSPDTALQSRLSMSKSPSCSSLGRAGTIKLLILAIVVPIMILTIVNPMWICIFMKYPHLHPVDAKVVPDHHVSHDKNVHHTQTHTKGGIKVTQESIDVIVASKDGRRIEELEATITVIENIQPSTNNKDEAHGQIHPSSNVSASKVNKSESTLDRIRERLFRNRTSCAYVALSVLLLCALTIYGIAFLSSGSRKMYESVNDDDGDDDENRCGDRYVEIEGKTNVGDDEELSEINATENQTISTQDACVVDCNEDSTLVQFNNSHFNDNISTSNLLPPPYSSNTNNEFISTPSSENIQQSTDENQKTYYKMHQKV